MYSFEKLEVWKKSRELVKVNYTLTQSFPDEEKFGLTSQLRRAAISVSRNIAEGSTRQSKKDKARFYEIAFGSLIEIMNQLILSSDLKYITIDELNKIRIQVDEIGRMLNALHQSTKNLSTKNPST